MCLQPLQSLDLVLQPSVQAALCLDFLALQEAKWPNAIVHLDDDNASILCKVTGVEVGVGVGLEPATLDEVHDRQLGLVGSI